MSVSVEKTLTLKLKTIELSKEWIFTILSLLNFVGDYWEVEIPSSIPNLEVKHFIADNTAGSPCGNVSRRQLLSIFKPLSNY